MGGRLRPNGKGFYYVHRYLASEPAQISGLKTNRTCTTQNNFFGAFYADISVMLHIKSCMMKKQKRAS